jgi:fumarate hydratase class II
LIWNSAENVWSIGSFARTTWINRSALGECIAAGTDGYLYFHDTGTSDDGTAIAAYVESSLMLATALSPVIGYDKTAQITHHALEKNLTLKQAALGLGLVSEADFDRIVDPVKMTAPSIAKGQENS